VDDTWSGLKLVIPVKFRPEKKKAWMKFHSDFETLTSCHYLFLFLGGLFLRSFFLRCQG
jgi:hypothetical protein